MGRGQDLLGRPGGQGLVPLHDGKAKPRLQPAGKAVDLIALDSLRAVQPDRVAHHDFFHTMGPDQPRDGFHVVLTIPALDRCQGLCGQAQLIGQSHADPPASIIQSHDSHK